MTVFPSVVGLAENRPGLFIGCSFHKRSGFFFFEFVIHWDQQRVNVSRCHIEITLGAENKLKVQHIEFLSISFGDLCEIISRKKFLTHMPDQGKIIKVESHSIIKQKSAFAVLNPGQWSIKFISLQCIDKFLHIAAGDQPVDIQFGMPAEKFSVRRNIDRVCVAVIKQIGHDLLEHTDLVTSGIKIQEFTLFRVCKLVYF